MINASDLIRPHIRQMAAYEPILPFEVLSEQLGRPSQGIVKLDANENPYGALPEVTEALAALPYAHIYPDPECRQLRAALAEYHQVPEENLLISSGADELIDLLMRLTLDPGDTILDCPPTFGMYAFDAAVNGAGCVSAPRRADFSLDIKAIEEAVAAKQPKLLFIANPNNPDGSLTPAETIERLLALPVLVVLDEAYVEFAPDETSFLQQVPQRPNLAVLRTFSKWAGLAGMRVGYGGFPAGLVSELLKIKQPYNVPVASATAAQVSLAGADKLAEAGRKVVAERDRLYQRLCEIDWLKPYPSQANFILCKVLGRDAAQVKEQLARAGILLRYFNKPGLADHLRISVGRPADSDRLIATLISME